MRKEDLLGAINSLGDAGTDLHNSCETAVEDLLSEPWVDKIYEMKRDLTEVYENLLLKEVGIEKQIDTLVYLPEKVTYRECLKNAVSEGLKKLKEEKDE